VYDLLVICSVGCDQQNFGNTLYSGKDKKTEVGETFKARVSDDPNAIVEPKILGTETFWDKGDSQVPLEKFKREARLCQNLSRDYFDLIIEPIQRFRKG